MINLSLIEIWISNSVTIDTLHVPRVECIINKLYIIGPSFSLPEKVVTNKQRRMATMNLMQLLSEIQCELIFILMYIYTDM